MSQKYEYFGKYILLEKLATGGMAEVWLARAAGAGGIGKFVAIKKILPQFSDNPEFMQMFKDEATIAMNLSHSNIVSIYEFGQEKSQLFLVMDYVEGRNLRQILNKLKTTSGRFSTDQIVYAVKEVAAGLDHAHRSLNNATGKPLNITHRDMSPQNIMITFEGEVKIVDFGIAKAESQIENTRTGTLKGKFGYMSPEQAEGHSTDLRTDIFSLGIVLWELLANDRLFIANNEINTLKKIRECNIPSLTKLNPNIHPELERITMKALTRDRNLRYQTAAAMHRDLSRFLNRQFPDFSPHDFSVFIKTIYTDEILEVRKRLVEYSKIPGTKDAAPIADQDKTQVTSFPQTSAVNAKSAVSGVPHSPTEKEITVTETETFSESISVSQFPQTNSTTNSANTVSTSDSVEINFESGSNPSLPVLNNEMINKTLTSKILINPKPPASPIRQEPVKNNAANGDLALDHTGAVSTHDTRQQVRVKKVKKRKSHTAINLMIGVASLIIVYIVGTVYFPNEAGKFEDGIKDLYSIGKKIIHKSAPVPPTSPAPSLPQLPPVDFLPANPAPAPAPKIAENLSTLTVSSNPSGAEIYLNGENTGKTTPHRILVPTNDKFSLTLKLNGFIDYIKTDLTYEKVGRSFTAPLQEALVAYVDIDVRPSRNVRIYVKGQLLKDEILPIIKYAIPAGQPVLIRAENQLTGAAAEELIELVVGQRHRVLLQIDDRRAPTGE